MNDIRPFYDAIQPFDRLYQIRRFANHLWTIPIIFGDPQQRYRLDIHMLPESSAVMILKIE